MSLHNRKLIVVFRDIVPANAGAESKIFYQPDDADDFDEEDPDDDLDI